MRDVQKSDHMSLDSLIDWLNESRFRGADFQREFECDPWDPRDPMWPTFDDLHLASLVPVAEHLSHVNATGMGRQTWR
jgi:hypothetical protein